MYGDRPVLFDVLQDGLFDCLVEIFKNEIDNVKIHEAFDILQDLGLIKCVWDKISNDVNFSVKVHAPKD
jgi:hypothetical protein